MNRVGIGVIGIGFMGFIHASICKELYNTELVGVADTDKNRLDDACSKLNVEGYLDYHELLDRKDVEAVIIATPEDKHLEPTMAAAKAGKHILLEKPIATTLNDADKIIDCARNYGVKLMVGHTLRFEANYVKIWQGVNSGILGKVIMINTRRDGTYSEAKRFAGRVPVSLYLGIHDADVVLWYINDQPIRVYAENVEGRVFHEFGVPDFTKILIKFKNGAVASIECGWALNDKWAGEKLPNGWPPMAGDLKVDVVGTDGSIHFSNVPPNLWCVDNNGWKIPVVDYVGSPFYNKLRGAWREEIEYFAKVITDDLQPIVSGYEAKRALEIILAAEMSARMSRPVNLPLEGRIT
jgi:predicted dehydrogenase